jgi:hypothetical protein
LLPAMLPLLLSLMLLVPLVRRACRSWLGSFTIDCKMAKQRQQACS